MILVTLQTEVYLMIVLTIVIYDGKTLVLHATGPLPKCQKPTLVKLVVGFQTNGRFLAKYTIVN